MGRQGAIPSRLQPSDPKVKAWRAVVTVHGRVMQRLDDELRARTDLDARSYDAMLHVYEAGAAGIRMADLAERVVLSKSGLTALVDKLEDRGLVRRLPDPADRRAIRVMITEGGLTTFRAAAEVHLAGIARHFGDKITAADAEMLPEILGRVEDLP